MASFIHYTDEKGLQGIAQSGKIKQSQTNAVFGPGVYGTKMEPDQGRKAIAQNNYDGMVRTNRPPYWEQQERAGKVDYAIKVDVPEEKVQRVQSNRDILLHKGDIDLRKHPHEVYRFK